MRGRHVSVVVAGDVFTRQVVGEVNEGRRQLAQGVQDGLFLLVKPNGRRYWRYRFTEMFSGMRVALDTRIRSTMTDRSLGFGERELPLAKAAFRQFAREELTSLNDAELLDSIDNLTGRVSEFAYYNIVGPMLALAYDGILRKKLSKYGIDSAVVDMTADEPRLLNYDPNVAISALQAKWLTLDDGERKHWRSIETVEQAARQEASDFQRSLLSFLDDFGHNSESGNDFSKPPWRHQLSHVWQLIDQHATPETQGRKTRFDQLELSNKQRRKLRRWYQRATRFRLHREQVSAQYTFGYGLIRDRFECLAARLVSEGMLDRSDDIYYLSHQ